jgi:hypothetical protein
MAEQRSLFRRPRSEADEVGGGWFRLAVFDQFGQDAALALASDAGHQQIATAGTQVLDFIHQLRQFFLSPDEAAQQLVAASSAVR